MDHMASYALTQFEVRNRDGSATKLEHVIPLVRQGLLPRVLRYIWNERENLDASHEGLCMVWDHLSGPFFTGGRLDVQKAPTAPIVLTSTGQCGAYRAWEMTAAWGGDPEDADSEFAQTTGWGVEVILLERAPGPILLRYTLSHSLDRSELAGPFHPSWVDHGNFLPFFTSSALEVRSDGMPLGLAPIVIGSDVDIDFVRRDICSPNRTLPILVVNAAITSDRTSVDMLALMRLVTPFARVYVPLSDTIAECYQKYVAGGDDNTFHVYSWGSQRPKKTPDSLRKLVESRTDDRFVQAAVWGGCFSGCRYQFPFNMTDVQFGMRGTRLKAIELALGEKEELLRLYEDDNASLRATSAERVTLRRLLDEESRERESARQQLAEAERSKRQMEYEFQDVLRGYRDKQLAREATSFAVPHFKWPKTLGEFVIVASDMVGGRIVFTDSAMRSAEESAFQHIDAAWTCVHEMATRLYDLHFIDCVPAIEVARRFENATGLELAVHESKGTKNDPKLRALREVMYKGKTYSMLSHVKCVKKGEILRVHYALLPAEKRILIGHFGDHLKTSKRF